MRQPQRLKHDATQSAMLRDALEAETELVGDYDLAAMRQQVVDGARPPAPSPIRWWMVVGISALTAAFVTLAMQQPIPAIQPTSSPSLQQVPKEDQRRSHRVVTEPTTEAEADRADPPTAVPPSTVPPATPVANTPVHSPDDPAAPKSTPEPQPPKNTSGLAAELAALTPGLDAVEHQEWLKARRSFTDFLAVWPDGQLSTEAYLGLLTATVESASAADSEQLSRELLARKGLGSRRSDITFVLAESLARQGRCDEALQTIQGFRRSSRVNSIRRSCRRSRQAP